MNLEEINHFITNIILKLNDIKELLKFTNETIGPIKKIYNDDFLMFLLKESERIIKTLQN